MPYGAPVLELRGITKAFGGVEALRGVDFTLRAGMIHGLVGENGAGKSTLMKIIAGDHADFAGSFELDGRAVRFRSARDALAAGIAMVHQELSIAPDLSVAENVFLGKQPTNRFGLVQWRRMAREAGEQLARLGIDIDPRQRIGDLPIGVQQLVEITRVLFSGARIIILDEPTSALSPPEVERLFAILRRLREDGRSIVFISHFIDDMLRVSDRVTVFRNGRKVGEREAGATSKDQLIEAHDRPGWRAGSGRATCTTLRCRRPASSRSCWRSTACRMAAACATSRSRRGRARCWASTASWAAGQLELARVLFGKLKARHGERLPSMAARLPSPARRARAGPASPSCPRAGARCCSARSRSTRTCRSASSTASRRLLLKPAARAGDRRAPGQPAADQAARGRTRSGLAVGRQPAEGGTGQMADLSAEAAAALRADPRHGCRRQGRRGQHRARPQVAAGLPSSCCRPNPKPSCPWPTGSSC